jgi:hypothetical protein
LFSHFDAEILKIPLGPKLANYLATLSGAESENTPLFPKKSRRRPASLGREFARLAKKAGGGNLLRASRKFLPPLNMVIFLGGSASSSCSFLLLPPSHDKNCPREHNIWLNSTVLTFSTLD